MFKVIQHAINQTLAERAAGNIHGADFQSFKQGQQNSQATWENRLSIRLKTIDHQIFQVATVNTLLSKVIQIVNPDSIADPLCDQNFCDGLWCT